MKKFFFVFFVIVLMAGLTSAQITVSMPEVVSASEGSVVSIPVNVTNFNNIGAITLVINYDPAVLTFQGTPNPISGSFAINASNGRMVVGWFGLTPLNAGTKTLFNINFKHISGTSNLTFRQSECEIANSSAIVQPVTYTNGKVLPPVVVETASIGDKVFIDANKNGVFDSGEAGLQGVSIDLHDCAGIWKAHTSTNANGEFLFSSLEPGEYYLKFFLKDDNNVYTFSAANSGGDDAVDSDVEVLSDTSGKTACTALIAGENDLSWDCGVYLKEIPVIYGSIGNFVWLDSNKNGIQDSGENGFANVTVKLLNSSYAEIESAVTGSNGEYLFDSLAEGTYSIQFVAPSGYEFVTKDAAGNDAVDSDADVSNGKTESFILAEGINNLSIDAGLSVIEVVALTPLPVISITDGLVTMPDSLETTTYVISYSNTGEGPLYNAIITDSLPVGVTFVSASGGGVETAPGSNVVVFSFGTLAAGQSGTVNVVVQVTNYESEYLNNVYLTGTDSEGKEYLASAKDLNLYDTTSSGGSSGVESTGDMAELLLRREWKIRNGLTTPVLAKSKGNSISSQFGLKELVPAVGPYNSTAIETTPFDILGISNAVASYAVDYSMETTEGDRRVASIFSTITVAPKIYDHTKAVCDRLAGSAIDEITLVDVNGYKFYAAKLKKSSSKTTDYAVSFSVYETSAGYFVENKWTYGEYDAPDGATSVYNFQAWAGSYENAVELVKSIIANISARGTVSYMNDEQSEPEVFIKSTNYTHDGYVHLNIVNNTSLPKQLNVVSYVRYSQGDELIQGTTVSTVDAGESELLINTGIVANAQVKITGVNGFADEVYVSGGTFANVTGSESIISEFTTSGYPAQNPGAFPEGTVLLAGGAYVAGTLNDWVTIIRSLSTNDIPYDLTGYNQISFTAKGTGVLTVILDITSITNYNYFAKNITLTENETEYTLDFSDFSQLYGSDAEFDVSKMYAAGFIYNTNNNAAGSTFNFEVKDVRFNPANSTSVDNDGGKVVTYNLAQNFPNPFNPSTVIEYSVAAKEKVSLKVFDMLGQEVAELVNEELEPGKYYANFNAANLSSGVYFYRLNSNSINLVRKMTLTK